MQGQNGFFIQFLRLAGPFWNSENKAVIRNQTLALIVLTVLQMALAVIITEWSAALFNALEQHSMSGLLVQVSYLVLIFATSMAVTAMHMKVKRHLQIGWRSWLTERVIGQWMNNGRHYLISHIQTVDHDNPDGRIAEDIRIATDEAITLCHSLFYSLLLLISFTSILWELSGVFILDLGAFEFPVHGYLVWVAIIYSALASVLGWWASRPLTLTTNAMQTAEANFRFGLVRARENSQAIALIHGETNEKRRFLNLFQNITALYEHQTQAWVNILLFNSGYGVLSMAFPILIAAPRYILGSLTLGALMQAVQAFQQMSAALSWPVNNMAPIAQWRASVERVLGLVKALEDLELEIARPDPQRILLERPDKSTLSFHDLCISQLDGKVMICGLNAEIRPGERVLISGDVFTGARLFKAIAGLWPWGRGSIELPDGEPLFFMPPRPYLPDGTLHVAICYPSPSERFSFASIDALLNLAGLEELRGQLEQTDAWDKVLTREQQQRLGLVRLLLYRPKWILLQEAFDSLDPDGEVLMLRIICQQLPDAALLSITNQPTAIAFHHRKIIL
ncbi:ABC transporter ATP-binding protein/permease [Methylobacter sp. S3L5C]|uniref:ABC transporter ATP-binding protein/permease n=1 Tax=Methylobacter sp. S3L5C TaxID=2839024 RepID=UPI001FACD69A|nr:ABC transporter ATP-binding protein/permease [Methylobacter sp. S3L5C]UOA09474.1 ABC transporter ATP-binding protein/permease [Methylobacter sp. S3L5C]